MRVLIVARYFHEMMQKKLACLCREPEMEIWHLVPSYWPDAHAAYQMRSRSRENHHQIAWPAIKAPDGHRFLYWPPPLMIRRLRPDLIHLDEEPESLVAVEFTLLRRFLAPRSKYVLFTWQNIRRQTHPPVGAVARFSLRAADGVICGNAGAVGVVRSYGYQGPVSIIPQTGVDPEDFAPLLRQEYRSRYGLTMFTAGFAGRLSEEKGLLVFLEAARPVRDMQAVCIGAGPLAENLRRMQTESDWLGRLVLTGGLTLDETARGFSALDALVLPSLTRPHWKEQFGRVLVEAMAAGVPVVGSDSGAIPEVIGDAGIIVAEGDPVALREALLRIKTDLSLRADLVARGKARVLKRFTHPLIASATADFYRRIAGIERR